MKDKTVARDRAGVRFAFIITGETFDTLFPFSLAALAAGRVRGPTPSVSVDFVALTRYEPVVQGAISETGPRVRMPCVSLR